MFHTKISLANLEAPSSDHYSTICALEEGREVLGDLLWQFCTDVFCRERQSALYHASLKEVVLLK